MNADHLMDALIRPEGLRHLSVREWEGLIGYARTTQLLSRLALQAESGHCLADFPTGPRRHLESARTAWQAQERALRWDIDCIGRILGDIDTPVVLLKGAAYAMAGLPTALGRIFGDIDIMVRKDRLADVEAALYAHGWLLRDTDPYDQHYYRNWMHELPPMQHVLRRTVLDVHHTIAPPTSRHNVEAAKLFAAATPLAIPGNFFVLAPTDMLLHAVVHLMQEGEFERGLRDLMDIDQLFRHFARDANFWLSLLHRTADHRLGRPLYYAVEQVRRRLGTPMPADFLVGVRQFAPSRLTRSVMNSIFDAGIAYDPPRQRRALCRFSRWILYARGHYMRMPLPLLIPHLTRKMLRRMQNA